ncbi:hypothetical protein TARUN_743 [Trichoderma arundinaceum]|uniref:NWD NACHT-NTPase N-terminal domain-containing protein n=1 Tax=Trichoderma arundinaceum TaxID=490622 RepID=A0A395NZF5_TRIAR|nr:hypothetical protein TARUN_743 [Trichoderma arundinaceum]
MRNIGCRRDTDQSAAAQFPAGSGGCLAHQAAFRQHSEDIKLDIHLELVQEDPRVETDTPSVKKSIPNGPAADPQRSPDQVNSGSRNQINNLDLLEKQSLNPRDNVVPIRDLWYLAYERLRKEDEQLISDYEVKIQANLSAGLSSTIGSNVSMRDRMDTILHRKMDEINRAAWIIRFGSSEVQVKDGMHSLSPNPCASMAWVGVSLLLPLFLHPSEKGASLAEGLEYLSSLIVQSCMREDLYFRRHEAKTHDQESPLVSHAAYKNTLEMLYKDILRFQATSCYYYANNIALRLVLDFVKWDGWNKLLAQIQERER